MKKFLKNLWTQRFLRLSFIGLFFVPFILERCDVFKWPDTGWNVWYGSLLASVIGVGTSLLVLLIVGIVCALFGSWIWSGSLDDESSSDIF